MVKTHRNDSITDSNEHKNCLACQLLPLEYTRRDTQPKQEENILSDTVHTTYPEGELK